MVEEEVTQEAQVAEETYELHVSLAVGKRPTLMKSAQLAQQMGLITKPTLTELINLYIKCGQDLLHKIWLDKMGYK